MSEDIDEVALNTLLAEGVDFPTAYAASVRDNEPREPKQLSGWFVAGAVLGVIVFVLILLAS